MNKNNTNESVPVDGSMSFGNMNIDDFILSGIGAQEPSGGGPSQATFGIGSGTSTPYYSQSPAPSGPNTPAQNQSAPFSPANVSINSPHPANSPMPAPSPSANGPHGSRPASTNSSMYAPPASPYGQAVPSPLMMSPMHQQSSTAGVSSMTPPVNPMSTIRMPSLTPPISQSNGNIRHTPGGMKLNMVQQHGPPMVAVAPLSYREAGMANHMKQELTYATPTSMCQMKQNLAKQGAGIPMNYSHVTQEPGDRNVNMMGPIRHYLSQPGFNRVKSAAYKFFELNRRLQDLPLQTEIAWWEQFAYEFFEDNAMLTMSICLEEGIQNFCFGRTLIPRFFKSFFDGGVMELFFNLKQLKEWRQNNSIILDTEHCAMETLYVAPLYTKVICEGRLMVECVANEMMRIKSWNFAPRGWQEHIPRGVLSMQAQQQNPMMLNQLSKNITRYGFPGVTMNYLKLCCVLQPMQHLMTMQKATGMDPRDCLKTTLVQKWPKVETNATALVPQELPKSPVAKQRKKRRNAAVNTRKKRSPEPLSIAPVLENAEVMVVGEPSVMGGGLGNNDERVITRAENMQFPTTALVNNALNSTLPNYYDPRNAPKYGMANGQWQQ